MSSWREVATSFIREGIQEYSQDIPDADALFKKISREKYPFGERQYYPYKAWLQEIAHQKQLYIWKGREPEKKKPDPPQEGPLFGGVQC